MKILHLVSDLGATATGRRVASLTPLIDSEQRIVVLETKPFFKLDAVFIPLRSVLDVAVWRKIQREIDDYQPALIHAWGRRAVELLNGVRTAARLMKTFDGNESMLSRRIGKRLELPPFAEKPILVNVTAIRQELNLDPHDLIAVAADRFEKPDAMKRAIWANDLIRESPDQWKLLLLGHGPSRERVERYAAKLQPQRSSVQFLGLREASPILAVADVVWHTRSSGGQHFLCEAAARGVPVIAAEDAIEIGKQTMNLFSSISMRESARAKQLALAEQHRIEPVLQLLKNAYANR